MASINKNFVVKHGLEVNNNLIFANADNGRVGIATTNPLFTLDVRGGIGVSNASIAGVTTTSNLVISGGYFNAAGSPGVVGQYLRSTGTGVEWASFPTLRTDDTFTAGVGQTTFSYAYTPGFLDVYVNGVKLNDNDFTASNGTQVILRTACFGGEEVDFIGYNPTAVGAGGTGILGITVKNQGVIFGNDNGVTSIDFVGTGINAVGTGAGVTVTFAADPGWAKTASNVYTSFNVGIGTTIPRNQLHVVGVGSTALFVDGNARITGILSIGTSSITLDGTTDTLRIGSAVTISSTTLTVTNLNVTGTTSGVVASGAGITVRDGGGNLGVAQIIDFGNNLTVDFTTGIATVNATAGGGGGGETLDATLGLGNTSSRGMSVGVVTATQFVRSGGNSNQFLKADGSSDPTSYLPDSGDASGLTNLTGASAGTYGSSTTIPAITVNANGRITGIATTSITLTGSGANLTNLTGASAGTYGSSTTVPVIVVDSNGRITGITSSVIVGGGGGASVTISDTAPSSPSVGNLWYNSLVGRGFIFYNDGSSSQWVDFGPSVGGFSTEPATLGSLSVSIASSGISTLSYNNMTGVFTFTPPNLSGYTTEGYVGLATSGLLSSTGSASSLTSLTGADAGIYGNATTVPVIAVNSSGRIIGIASTSIIGISDGDKGDITVSASGSNWVIDNDVVTYDKIQNVTNGRILGRSSAGAGNIEEISVGTGLTLSGSTLTSTIGGETLDATLGLGNTSSRGMSVGIITSTIVIPTELRTRSIAEKTTLINGNSVGLEFSTGGGNVAICTNPTGDITLNVTNIPTDSSFDNHSISFSVIVNQTGTARTCTAVNLNGVSRTIRWSGGSLANALSGVSTSTGFDIFTFTGINTVGSASTTANYTVLGSVNGGFN